MTDSNSGKKSGRRMTPDQLRAATDRGRTGDKVDHFDPAAAPLGTDEEAGGGRLVVSEDDIRRATTPPPVAAEPHRFFIWGFAPLLVIIGFVALGLILAGLVLFSAL